MNESSDDNVRADSTTSAASEAVERTQPGAEGLNLTVVFGDDWVGWYDRNGRLLDEGHSVDAHRLVHLLGYRVAVRTADEAWLEYEGRLPDNLADVRFKSYSTDSSHSDVPQVESGSETDEHI